MYLLAIFISSLEKCLFSPLLILNQVVFLLLSFRGSLYILLIPYVWLLILPLNLWVAFLLCWYCLFMYKNFLISLSSIYFFLLLLMPLMSYPRLLLPDPKLWSFRPMFPFKNFIVLSLLSEKTLETLLDSKEIQPVLNIHWKDWCWSWNSNPLATWCEELTLLKKPWCWERLRAGGEGDDRGFDGWMASSTQWTWVWVNSRSWWWTGRPGVLRFMGLQRVGHDWVTELN